MLLGEEWNGIQVSSTLLSGYVLIIQFGLLVLGWLLRKTLNYAYQKNSHRAGVLVIRSVEKIRILAQVK